MPGPAHCVCATDFSNFYFYPIVAALIGARWISEAAAAHQQAPEVVAVPVEDPDEEGAQMVQTSSSLKDQKDIPIVTPTATSIV